MVRFELHNTSQHFVSHEGTTFVCGFILKSDWLLLNFLLFVRHSRQKLYGSATRPLSDFRMGPGNKASTNRSYVGKKVAYAMSLVQPISATEVTSITSLVPPPKLPTSIIHAHMEKHND